MAQKQTADTAKEEIKNLDVTANEKKELESVLAEYKRTGRVREGFEFSYSFPGRVRKVKKD